jgi:hypothetical protein
MVSQENQENNNQPVGSNAVDDELMVVLRRLWNYTIYHVEWDLDDEDYYNVWSVERIEEALEDMEINLEDNQLLWVIKEEMEFHGTHWLHHSREVEHDDDADEYLPPWMM